MAMNNTYGIVKTAIINPEKDVEIWVRYSRNRTYTGDDSEKFRLLDNPANILVKSETVQGATKDGILVGMYNLKLPVSEFGQKGFYEIYIKPKEVQTQIVKVGNLAAYPDIVGIVIDCSSLDELPMENGGLTGYRVEYYGTDGKRNDFFRIVTSNNRCEVMSGSLSSVNSDLTSYRFNDGSSLQFLTLTPSTSPEFMANSKPYIGVAGQTIGIINTKFDPVMIEVEITENDFDTLALSLDGNQVRSLDKGTVTTFNEDEEIFMQKEFFTAKDNYTHRDVFEVRTKRTDNIDMTVPKPSEL